MLLMLTVTCFARISTDDLVIGGIYPGQPWSEVISLYGQPSFENREPDGNYRYYYEKNGQFGVDVVSGHVTGLYNTGNTSLTTTKNIRLGSTREELIQAYGQPDQSFTENGTEYITYNTNTENEGIQFRISNGRVKIYGSFGTINTPKPSKTNTPSNSIQEIPEKELSIGGITVGQNLNYVEQIYGKPSKIINDGTFKIYNYNDRFIVKGKSNKICSVAIYEKGIATPSGFTGETPYKTVKDQYGDGHKLKYKGELKDCKEDYTYFCNDKQIVFIVNKKNIIKGICVEELDDERLIKIADKIKQKQERNKAIKKVIDAIFS